MRKLFLWLFVLLVLVWSVNAWEGNVQLIYPENNPSPYQEDVNIEFKCSIEKSSNVNSITLHVIGQWSPQPVENSTLITELGTTLSATFLIEDFKGGDYNWWCNASDGTTIYSSNQIRTFNVQSPPLIGDILNQTEQIGSSAWSLDLSYYNESGGKNYHWYVSDDDPAFCDVSIADFHKAWFDPVATLAGSDEIIFTLKDLDTNLNSSKTIKITLTESGSPQQEICDNGEDDNSDGKTDCQDNITCPSNPNNCQDAICNSAFDWEYTIKSSADCDSDDDCDSDEECDLSDCTCKETSSDDDETCSEQSGDKCSSSEVCDGDWLTSSDSSRCCSVTCTPKSESGLSIIKSHTPSNDKINLKVGDSKIFKIIPSGDTTVGWYLDEEKIDTGESYTFKPEKNGTYELIAVIGDNPSLKNNDDFYMWTVTVGEEDILAGNICGNDKVDSGETCGNCARDVKCADGEKCVNDECVQSTGFFSSVSGYAVDAKDFVVDKWEYSSVIAGLIVVLIIAGLVYAGKRKKSDVLHEFGKENFFSKFSKFFKGKKKGYVTKKVGEKPTVEKQREVYIDKPFNNDEKKL